MMRPLAVAGVAVVGSARIQDTGERAAICESHLTITAAERQIGKCAELAAGFGGSVGAWRRIVGHDPRSDQEIASNIQQWRDSHPATRQFWKELARAIRVAIRTGQPILVAPAPRPAIVASFADGILRLTLPSGREITYPNARLVPGKFEDAPSDVEFMDNARGQWKPYRGWFGTFVENVVQGVARDLLAAAIERYERRGISVVFHCHDEIVAEVPVGSISESEFLAILLERSAWTEGLPLGGKFTLGRIISSRPRPRRSRCRLPLIPIRRSWRRRSMSCSRRTRRSPTWWRSSAATRRNFSLSSTRTPHRSPIWSRCRWIAAGGYVARSMTIQTLHAPSMRITSTVSAAAGRAAGSTG
jgi:hypothetical protein